MSPVVTVAAPIPTGDSTWAQSVTTSSSRATCVSRPEFKKIESAGKRATTPRKVRAIVGYKGVRVSFSRGLGRTWEIRKYLRCDSTIRHVYVNYRAGRAYRKAW